MKIVKFVKNNKIWILFLFLFIVLGIVYSFLNIKPIMSIKKDGTLGPIGVMWGKSNVVEKISKFN